MPTPLEKACTLPESGSPALVADLQSRLAVIVTHPWGPLGGSYNSNVVSAVVLYFQRLGMTTLRFNFVGSQIGRGNRQVQQVQEAADYLLQGKHLEEDVVSSSASTMAIALPRTPRSNEDSNVSSLTNSPTNNNNNNNKNNCSNNAASAATAAGGGGVVPTQILVVGYSYGALIGGSASVQIPQCVAVILIALPISVQHWLVLFQYEHMRRVRHQRPHMPRLLIMGSRDNFTSEDLFAQTIVHSFPKHSTTGAVLLGADHFFVRREKDVMDIIGQWLLGTFPECQGDVRQLANHLSDWRNEIIYPNINNNAASSSSHPTSNLESSICGAPYCGILHFPMSGGIGVE